MDLEEVRNIALGNHHLNSSQFLESMAMDLEEVQNIARENHHLNSSQFLESTAMDLEEVQNIARENHHLNSSQFWESTVMDLKEEQKEEVMNLEAVREEEMAYLENVKKEELPYHARIYDAYLPMVEKCDEEELVFLEGDEALKVISEDTPIVDIIRARENDPNVDKESKTDKVDDESKTFEKYRRLVYHDAVNDAMSMMEYHIVEKKMTISDFKIFYVWKTIFNMKQHDLSWYAIFQRTMGKIKLEICTHEKTENEISPSKIADFIIDTETEDCDKRVTATGSECIVQYSLFSNAYRVKFEIRSYNADGSQAHNVSGHVTAVYYCAGGERTYDLLGGKNKKSEHIEDTLTSRNLILPSDIGYFDLKISLSDDIGNFVFKEDVDIYSRKVAIDEQHYIMGEKGYIVLTILWACLCADMEQGGVCTCPSIHLGHFLEENNDNGEDSEDIHGGRVKRAKIRQSSSGEDSNSIKDGDLSTCRKRTSGEDGNAIEVGDSSNRQKGAIGEDGNAIELGDSSICRKATSSGDGNATEVGDPSNRQKSAIGEDGNAVEVGDSSTCGKATSSEDGNAIKVGDSSPCRKAISSEDGNATEDGHSSTCCKATSGDDSSTCRKATSGEDGSTAEVGYSSTCPKATRGEDGKATEVGDSSTCRKATSGEDDNATEVSGSSTCRKATSGEDDNVSQVSHLSTVGESSSVSQRQRPDNIKICTTTQMFGNEIQKATLKNSDVLIVICFVAKWSDKCKHMEKYIDDLAEKEKDVLFLTVDIDDLLALAMEWKALTVPIYVLLKRELIVDVVYGLNRKALVHSVSKWKFQRMPQYNTQCVIPGW